MFVCGCDEIRDCMTLTASVERVDITKFEMEKLYGRVSGKISVAGCLGVWL